jgi:hypothetical protein
VAVAAALLLGGCLAEKGEPPSATTVTGTGGSGGTGGGGGTATSTPTTTETWTKIQAVLAAPSSGTCNCHQNAPAGSNGNVGFRAGDYAAIANVTSPNFSQYSIVKKSDSANSTLYLMASGGISPAGAFAATNMKLSAAEAARIKDWIDGGAPQ